MDVCGDDRVDFCSLHFSHVFSKFKPSLKADAFDEVPSSLTNAALPADAVYFGEVSLSGAIRPVAQSASRLKEAAKLGFGRAVVPEAARAETVEPDLTVTDVANLANLVADIATRGKVGMTAKTGGQNR